MPYHVCIVLRNRNIQTDGSDDPAGISRTDVEVWSKSSGDFWSVSSQVSY